MYNNNYIEGFFIVPNIDPLLSVHFHYSLKLVST